MRWCEFAWRDRVYSIIHFQVRARLHLISWLGLRKLSCCITCITSLKPVRKRLHLAAFSIQDWKNLVFKSNAGKIFTKIIPSSLCRILNFVVFPVCRQTGCCKNILILRCINFKICSTYSNMTDNYCLST